MVCRIRLRSVTSSAAESDNDIPVAGDAVASVDGEVRDKLLRMRSSIDNIDAALVHMLAERFKCTQAVGRLKADNHVPPADPGREVKQVARLRELAEESHLDPEFAEKFLNFIVAEVIHHHEQIGRGGEAWPSAPAGE